MATVAEVNFQISIGENWAVLDDSDNILSWHGSRGAAAKVASQVPTYTVGRITVEEVEEVDTVTINDQVAQTSNTFWSYSE